jgi:hypothetical protein
MEISVSKNHTDTHPRHKGFIVFCETKLRYEKGLKAWIFLGPYLLGALGLETMITVHAKTVAVLGPWLGFLAYLILFPLIWRRILKFIALKLATSIVPLR